MWLAVPIVQSRDGHPIQWWAYSWVFFLLFIHLTWTSLDDKQTARVHSFSLYLISSISALLFFFFFKWIKSVFRCWWATLFPLTSGDQHGRLFWSSTHHATIYRWHWHNRLTMQRMFSNCFFSLSLPFEIIPNENHNLLHVFYSIDFSIHRCLSNICMYIDTIFIRWYL